MTREIEPDQSVGGGRCVGTGFAVAFGLRHRVIDPSWGGQTMKMITAVIKPFKLDDVRKALNDAGVTGMVVSEVKGFGRQKGHKEIYRGAEYETNLIPKVMVQVAVPSEQSDKVVKALIGSARTGEIGDGKIFVSALNQVVRIRTGEMDEAAI
jgi:nitrogen regulatory protein PII